MQQEERITAAATVVRTYVWRAKPSWKHTGQTPTYVSSSGTDSLVFSSHASCWSPLHQQVQTLCTNSSMLSRLSL
jgi:hypothetical protein